MIAHTHRLIGEFLYHQLSTPKKQKLNHQLFVNGNVKPDVVKHYRQMSHYYRDNHEFVFGLLEKLVTEKMSKDEFSDHLGILIHFLCDYTCVYHANDFIHKAHSIRLHMQYEMKFHVYSSKKFRKLKDVSLIPFKDVEGIKLYVRELITKTNIEDVVINVESDFNEMVTLAMSTLNFVLDHRKYS